MSNNENEEKISIEDAILLMRQGSTMLKCGRTGAPHFRHFTLEDDFNTLKWVSPKKKKDESTIKLDDVQEFIIGQKTTVFSKNRLPQYENLSFSLVYGDRTLDIVCKDKKEFETWEVGLTNLISNRNNINLDKIKPTKRLNRLASENDRLSVIFKGSQTIVRKREDSSDVYSWGQGINGRLGHGDEEDQLVPKVIEALLGKDIRAIACGPCHTAALNADGDLYTWGAGSFGRLGHGLERDRFSPMLVNVLHVLQGMKVVQVACGDFHTAALLDCGAIFTWGKGNDGRLGHNDEETVLEPKQVMALSEHKVIYIACGYVTTAAITSQGNVYVWGGNEKGQLGHGDRESKIIPTQIEELQGIGICQIACATWHTAAISVSGDVYTWGNGSNGKLGHGDEEDKLVPCKLEDTNFIATQISCGDFHTAVLTDAGVLYTWGEGNYGQLGHGDVIAQYNKPLKVGQALEGKTIVQIACGANHTAALLKDGKLYTWGYAVNGRLGHGNEEDQNIPQLVSLMRGKHVKQIACGGSHSACTIVHDWIPDEEANDCMACKKIFTFVNRRHHCRNCGGIFCGSCSGKRFPLLKDGSHKPVRVCDRCYDYLDSYTK
eukprot:TRINITY_DN2781_c1_g1_i1.p1 TRINITY_DN2781_c1_g1~~TRINITY_DN2781_c1_g1_i1.p1  ORF type:complete len:604 (+),score=224.26 TRINITY_DN2781_c1_g1_i1:84-1895(+)